MESVTLSQIHRDLMVVKKDLEGIKRYMKDLDSFMTFDDFEALKAYKQEKAEGRLTSHADLKKELGL